MSLKRSIEVKGHIIDSLTLTKIMDIILDMGGECNVEKIRIGKEKAELSYAKLNITTETDDILNQILEKVIKQGANVL